MFEFLHSPSRNDAGPLTSVATADQFWRTVPRNDPFEAQLSVSEILADFGNHHEHHRDHLRALLTLDQRSRKLGEALLINYAVSGTQPQSLQKRSWQAAFQLSRSFAQVYAHVLQRFRTNPSRGFDEYVPAILFRLLQHRQVEFLLRPFVLEQTFTDCWTDLHAAYLQAQTSGVLTKPVTMRRLHEQDSEQSTIELEYISLLLLEQINAGQFSPYDAFWLNRRIPRWCSVLSLQADPAHGAPERPDDCFLVDLGSAQGMMRPSSSAAGKLRYLDPAPMLALVGEEIAALRDRDRPVDGTTSFGRGRQLKLLRKLNSICTPNPAPINRRGERKPAASTVKAVVGLAHIIRMLRNEEHQKVVVAPPVVPEVEEITITVFGGYSESSPSRMRHGGRPGATEKAGDLGVPHQVWQLKDRSESGCGLRGLIRDSNRVLPGALVAFRERDDVPWTLAVVRRLQKRIGDRIDIGVEYVGNNPTGVTMSEVVEIAPAADGSPPDTDRHRCPALYLPESPKRPAMPFKTLILSPKEFKVGRCLRLRADHANYTVRMKEPIEEQDDFIWLPYEVVQRRTTDPAARESSRQGRLEPRPVSSPGPAESTGTGQNLAPPANRVAGAATG